MKNPETTIPAKKKAVLFYNKIPFPFSEYACYHIDATYIALCEEADNACVLCRVLDEKEIPMFGKRGRRDNGKAQNRYTLLSKHKRV